MASVNRERLYVLLMGMKQRCSNSNHISYHNYGGIGVKVCDEWCNNYYAFKQWALDNGYDETLPRGVQTIERIDKTGDYEPSNCCWISIQEQQQNKRVVPLYEYKGEKHSIPQWAEILGISKRLLSNRIHGLKWDFAKAVETPFNKKHSDKFRYAIYKGEEVSVLQISKEIGICRETIISRLDKGMTIDEIIKEYSQNDGYVNKYEYNGKRLTISEWSQLLEIPENTLRARLRIGKPYNQVFSKKKLYGKKVKAEING